MEQNRRRRSRRNRSRAALIGLCVVLALILAVLIAITAVLNHIYGSIQRPDDTRGTLSSDDLETIFNTDETIDPTFDGTEIDPSDVTWNTLPTIDISDNPDVINILLIGTDGRPWEGPPRSDSMILCTFDTVNKKLVMTSFMRDLYVQIPGYDANRINVAYPLGGMNLLTETLAVNFGVHVDACVEVNFYGFPQIVDNLGGIDIELSQEEATFLNENGNWYADGGTPGGVWTLTAGVNHLNGEQALAYSRIRAIGDDFQRTERQRKVLSILVDQCKTMDLSTALNTMNSMLYLVTTDMTNQQITSYALEVFPMLSEMTIVSQRVPVWGTYENAVISGMQVLLPDLPKIQQILKDTGVIYESAE
ncbi:MAG: LCP family protein [Faecousia sp.]